MLIATGTQMTSYGSSKERRFTSFLCPILSVTKIVRDAWFTAFKNPKLNVVFALMGWEFYKDQTDQHFLWLEQPQESEIPELQEKH